LKIFTKPVTAKIGGLRFQLKLSALSTQLSAQKLFRFKLIADR
jgi:hypothetical protein